MTEYSPCRVMVLLDSGQVNIATVRSVVPSYTPGGFLAAYDPEQGIPSLRCTIDVRDALCLPSDQMIDLYRSTPSKSPVRPDGHPNRPLTAFTVEVVTREEYVR